MTTRLRRYFKRSALLGTAGMVLAPLFQGRAETVAPNAPVVSSFAQQVPGVRVPVWRDARGSASAEAVLLFSYLESSWQDGLNPASYNTARMMDLSDIRDRAAQGAEFDRLMTAAFVKYVQDMSGPRIDPALVKSRAEYWRRPLTREQVFAAYAQAGGMEKFLQSLAPRDPLYQALRDELVRLTNAPAEQARERIAISGLLYPGNKHRAVPQLRNRFGLSASAGIDATLYDPALVQAVQAFQAQNGLTSDGIIGPGTLEQINLTNADRRRQVIANLERLRWDLPRPGRYIEVNIANQTLQAYDGGQLVHNIDVIVGKAARQTREFHTQISGVRFNPSWYVPSGIMINDKLPMLKRDPYSLQRSNIHVYRDGQRIDPGSVNWNTITREELRRITMIQDPGPNNALGHVRVLMDNPYDEYLHYTNQPELFAREQRALSSGCMRMSQPDLIVSFIMAGGRDGWQAGDMERYKQGRSNNNINLNRPLEFFSVYRTVTLGAEGRITYHPDVYGRDKVIYSALEKDGKVFVRPAIAPTPQPRPNP